MLNRRGDCGGVGHLALAGQRLIWTETSCGNACQDYVMTAVPGGRPRLIKEHYYDDDGTGENVRAAAGDGSTLVYVTSNAVYRVRLDGRVAASDRGAWNDLAVASGRVALLPAKAWGCVCNREPSWGVDGRIYFASQREGIDWEVFSALGPDGTRLVQVTDTYTDEGSPDVSRSGLLVFVREKRVVVRARNGRGERRLIEGSSAAWSPDGSQLAVERKGRILVVTLANGALRDLGRGSDPQWSADGTRLVFDDDGIVVIADRDGTGRRRLVEGAQPSWGAGDLIAFAYGGTDDAELYTVASDGSGLRQLTNNDVDDFDPDWSPDGRRLVFVRDPDGEDEAGSELYVIDADGTRVSRLTRTKTTTGVAPAEVRSVATATTVSRLQAPGKPIAVGLSRSLAALLVSSSGRKQIFLYRPASGKRIGAVAVPPDTLPTLSVAGSNVVFQAGNSIIVLDAVRRTRAVLALTSGRSVGLSVEGRRVAWAERTPGTSRIRAVHLRS